eukprot:6019527-Prymnesium_polylepis.1
MARGSNSAVRTGACSAFCAMALANAAISRSPTIVRVSTGGLPQPATWVMHQHLGKLKMTKSSSKEAFRKVA